MINAEGFQNLAKARGFECWQDNERLHLTDGVDTVSTIITDGMVAASFLFRFLDEKSQ
jgi:hypothetical protein